MIHQIEFKKRGSTRSTKPPKKIENIKNQREHKLKKFEVILYLSLMKTPIQVCKRMVRLQKHFLLGGSLRELSKCPRFNGRRLVSLSVEEVLSWDQTVSSR
jgi:hypothetical protein